MCDLWNFQAKELAILKPGDYVKVLAITRKYSKQYNHWILNKNKETINYFLKNLPLNNIEKRRELNNIENFYFFIKDAFELL